MEHGRKNSTRAVGRKIADDGRGTSLTGLCGFAEPDATSTHVQNQKTNDKKRRPQPLSMQYATTPEIHHARAA